MGNNVSEPIFNAVNAYLESNDRLAFQINGPWGIGKTYYVKNEVISRLEGYNVIYFSFYGYDDLNAVKKALNIEILKKIIPDRYHPKFSFIENTFLSKYDRFKKLINKVFKRSELIFQFIELGFPFIQDFVIQKNVKNLVFILDDLERISDKIDLRDVLGFIQSELLERLNSKVVLISNESALRKTVDVSEKINEHVYFEIKEKVIGKTIEFKADDFALRKILESQDIVFVSENLDWVLKMLNLLKSTSHDDGINLRTLLCILDDFRYLSQKLVEDIDLLDSNQINKIHKSLFLNIFVITNEMKLGRLQRDDLNDLQKICNTRSFITLTLFDEDKPKSKSEKIIDKYHKTGNPKFDEYIFYHQDINKYIFTGYFAQSRYVSDWNSSFLQYEDIFKLDHFYYLTDKEFFEIQKNILKSNLENLPLTNILKLACSFKFFEGKKLLDIECNNYMDIIFPIAEKKAKNLGHTINKSSLRSYEEFSVQFPEIFEKLKKLSENSYKGNKIDELFSETDEIMVEYFPLDSSIRIFKELVEQQNKALKIIFSDTIRVKYLMTRIRYYKKNTTSTYSKSEIEEAKKFKELVYEKLNEDKEKVGKIATYLIKELMQLMEEVIQEFESKD